MEEPKDGRGRRVLVVEDHRDTREMVQAILETHGYIVCTAGHGLDALDRLEAERPTLILLDVDLPYMDGIGFVHEMRRHPDPELARTPVILLTAAADVGPARAQTAAVGVIRKPATMDGLLGAVARYYERQREVT
jgi:CheY-like chemotaxis protein